jgi:multidrug transporter EmrE-like cation transporter
VSEVVGTVALKDSLGPTVLVVVGYGLTFYLLVLNLFPGASAH